MLEQLLYENPRHEALWKSTSRLLNMLGLMSLCKVSASIATGDRRYRGCNRCWNRWQDKQRSPHSTPSTCTVSVLVYFGYQFGNRLFITGALVKTLKLSPLICNIDFAEDEKGWLHSLRRPILRDLTRIHYVYCSLKEEQNQIPRCRGVL